jgi:SMODS-associated and fused to various effectors sensor domain
MHETNEESPRGLLLLAQAAYLRPTLEEILRALPPGYRGVPHVLVDLDLPSEALDAVHARDFGPARRTLEAQIEERLLPRRAQYPDYRIVYFGSAPIPLTVWLGFRLETWQQVEVAPHHHARRSWGWFTDPGQPPARLAEVKLPDYRDRTSGEAVVRVSTSHVVDRQVTLRAVPEPLVEIDIALEDPSEDTFTSIDQMRSVAQSFRRALDVLGDNFPGVRVVHLFASVQPGMALLLGAQISRTMHPPVQTYQYERHAEDGPRHVRALLINAPSRPPVLPLTEEAVARAGKDRAKLQADLDRMKGFAERSRRHPSPSWVSEVLSSPDGHPTFAGPWLRLPRLHETPLPGTRADASSRSVDDSFRLSGEGDWQIDDHWLARLARRIPDDDERHRALRLLVLHEAVHRGPQALTRASSVEIGRFPRVLEEIDYHADVWAMLHEQALTELSPEAGVAGSPRFFADMIRLATETMWAFDDDGPPLTHIQIRRLNRYLIWYWQYLHVERAAKDAPTKLDDILALLVDKPVLELAGPPIVARGERVFFELDHRRMGVPELAIYHHGRLHRHGSRLDFPITELLQGVCARDGQKILGVLRSTFEQIVRE